MKTSCFDAVVNFFPVDKEKSLDAMILVQGTKISASFHFYERIPNREPGLSFVRVHSHKSLSLKWKDKFEVQGPGRQNIGEGHVLNPFSERISRKKEKKRIAFLECLQGEKKEMIFALVQEKGIQGLKERELCNFSSLSKKHFLKLSHELEAEGKIRILSFAPLLLLSQESLNFLCRKILAFLSHFHDKHTERTGVSLEKIKKKFDINPRILSLALKHLSRAGQINEWGDKIRRSDIKMELSPEEKKILQELEDMCFKGEFRLFSLEDLRKHFRLSSKELDRLLSFLIERKKIVQGKEGLLLHSRWLDEIIWRIKKSGKKELTVTDFKKISGLTRKYAIPLLELLDQMGITQRKGASREIL